MSVSKFKLDGYSGFDPTLCYGDILVSYNWLSSCQSQKNIDNKKCTSNEETQRLPTALCVDEINKKFHDFIRTHFHRATNCDFCTKKVFFYFFLISRYLASSIYKFKNTLFYYSNHYFTDLVKRRGPMQKLRDGLSQKV